MMNDENKNNIPPVAPGIFTLPPYGETPPALLGGYCPGCKAYYFPRPKYCRTCLGPVEETKVGSEGTIYSFTVIRKKAPFGLPLPYSVGFVDLKETGLRIFCLLDPAAIDHLRIGLPVQLAAAPLGHDGSGSPCLRPYFTPQPPKKVSRKRNPKSEYRNSKQYQNSNVQNSKQKKHDAGEI